MKRIFTIITILISLSVIGLILLQLSWLKNMVELRREQVKEKVFTAVLNVGYELAQIKGNLYNPGREPGSGLLSEGVTKYDFLKPQTIGRRFTAEELQAKIQASFNSVGLEKMKFEFAVEIMSPYMIERQSANYEKEYQDTANNLMIGRPLVPPSGSIGENLVIDETLGVIAVDWKSYAIKSLRWEFVTGIFFSIIILAAFYLTVRTMLRQKKLSEIKNDFINNMTHEFKTPIATISLAVDAMRNEKVLQDREKLSYFSTIIKEENKRMNRQVETILKASQLEKQEVDLNLKPVHVHEIIKDVVENFALQLEEKQGKAELLLNATNDLIDADEVHMSNLVNNLFDNALKYSKENVPPFVKLTTQSNGKKFIIRIEDNGIGMSRETLKRIFERFYRAHTGNIHNVKGFGLGLSYVKTMVEAHHGEIKADSTLGRGSTFIIEFPLKKIG
ncbi:MAG TPA: HAMP domain-containing sensor histidine kinase [Chitinophagaceae bacterium]|nr:HAMP domain-containing sensor histidine kinase [Chitinophagaceae bacterium]